MKYLKTYQVYESLTMVEFREEVDDLLLPFSDIGYNVENRLGPGGIHIKVPDLDSNMVRIKFKEIKEDLLRLLEYLRSNITRSDIEVIIQVTRFTEYNRPIYPPRVVLPIDNMIELMDRLCVGKARREENIDDFYVAYITIEPLG